MKMKKEIIFFTIIAMLLVLVGCGKSEKKSSDASGVEAMFGSQADIDFGEEFRNAKFLEIENDIIDKRYSCILADDFIYLREYWEDDIIYGIIKNNVIMDEVSGKNIPLEIDVNTLKIDGVGYGVIEDEDCLQIRSFVINYTKINEWSDIVMGITEYYDRYTDISTAEEIRQSILADIADDIDGEMYTEPEGEYVEFIGGEYDGSYPANGQRSTSICSEPVAKANRYKGQHFKVTYDINVGECDVYLGEYNLSNPDDEKRYICD